MRWTNAVRRRLRRAPKKALRAPAQLGAADELVDELRLLRGVGDDAPVVCGPFIGEIGYETLYWIPFVARLLESAHLANRPVLLISRGGTERLYRRVPACREARYVDVVDILGPEEFLAFERERLADDPRRKNQKSASEYENTIVEKAGAAGGVHVRPAHLFRLLRRHTVERVLTFPWRAEPSEREDLVVVKFWFGGQLPAIDQNLDFVRRRLSELMSVGPVIAIDNQFTLELDPSVDEPFRTVCREVGVPTTSTSSYRTNIAEQVELLRRARRFVGTYGGFSYLGLYTGTEVEAYYSSPKIVFSSHFVTLGYALACLNARKNGGEPAPFSLIRV